MNMTFRLLDLPSELWIKIGQIAIDSIRFNGTAYEEPLDMYLALVTNVEPVAYSPAWQQYHPPPITLACKVLRRELLPYFYQTRFKCYIFVYNADWTIQAIGTWLRAIGPVARRSVEDFVCYMNGNEDDRLRSELRLTERFGFPVEIVETPMTHYGTHERKNYILRFP